MTEPASHDSVHPASSELQGFQMPTTQQQVTPVSYTDYTESAVSRVLQTTELLEAILLEVPNPRDILLCQRICTRMCATIRGSLPLQRRLFTAPALLQTRKCCFNPMQSIVASKPSETRYQSVGKPQRRLNTAYAPDELKGIFLSSGSHYALTRIHSMRYIGSGRHERSTLLTFWSIMRMAPNETIPPTVYDLSTSSLRDMYLLQSSEDITAMFHCRSTETTIEKGSTVTWRDRGHFFGEVRAQDNTIGEIFAEMHRIEAIHLEAEGGLGNDHCIFTPFCESCEIWKKQKEENAESSR